MRKYNIIIVYTYIELGCGWLIPAPKVSKKHTSFISLPYAAVGIETLMEYSGARFVDNSFVNKIQNCDNSLYKFALRGISTYEKWACTSEQYSLLFELTSLPRFFQF